MMDKADYERWWLDNTDQLGPLPDLPEPVATLAAHVMALQERIDDLPRPDARVTRCGCAYDHPTAICKLHQH